MHERPLEVPDTVRALCVAAKQAGGRAWVIGGSVRDHLLGLEVKDYDIEVHGLDAEEVHALLLPLGPVNAVGRSFGVFKVATGGHELDVSIPRRDSNAGPGHKGIRVEGDPHMGFAAAARRRDLTINAIGFDPLDEQYEDPFGGRADVQGRRLRAVDAQTFGEDPLRALRVVQFAARFEFDIDPGLAQLCRQAPLHELPAERIWGEMAKLLLKARAPSRGLRLGRELGIWDQVLPEVAQQTGPQDDDAVDRAAQMREETPSPPEALALMLATWWAALDQPSLEQSLDRLRIHRLEGYPLRQRILELVHAPAWVARDDTSLRWLAERTDATLACLVAEARGARDARTVLLRAQELGIARAPLPPLLQGRDLARLGMAPGPEMGELLLRLRRAQLDGEVRSVEEAIAWVERARAAPEGAP